MRKEGLDKSQIKVYAIPNEGETDVRCPKCSHLLFRFTPKAVETKCTSCKTIVIVE